MAFRESAVSFEMVPRAGAGREFTARRRVRLGDATPNGRLRLDAAARFLQDVSNDDTRDAAWSDGDWWVVRRTVLDVYRFPRYLEEIDLTTWCGGIGSRWAERRTQITALDGEVLLDAAALWVHVDSETLMPSRVPEDVEATLTTSSGGREVGAKLLLKSKLFTENHFEQRAWPLRFTDFDVVKHMNNASYWEIVEEHLAAHSELREPMRAIVEHIVQVEPGQEVVRRIDSSNGDFDLQLMVGDTMHAAMWCGKTS
ncbi:MAG: acyl-ACP thioesterase domain-containing protein [Actinomycetes bacterium]